MAEQFFIQPEASAELDARFGELVASLNLIVDTEFKNQPLYNDMVALAHEQDAGALRAFQTRGYPIPQSPEVQAHQASVEAALAASSIEAAESSLASDRAPGVIDMAAFEAQFSTPSDNVPGTIDMSDFEATIAETPSSPVIPESPELAAHRQLVHDIHAENEDAASVTSKPMQTGNVWHTPDQELTNA
jgi:hypothetical protein